MPGMSVSQLSISLLGAFSQYVPLDSMPMSPVGVRHYRKVNRKIGLVRVVVTSILNDFLWLKEIFKVT